MNRFRKMLGMSPPHMVTEDTPPDMLTGHMDLRLVLHNGTRVRMSVDRKTPMMDLLVQVTTAYKISPAGYVLQPYGETGVLPYKPSTPIGALDTWTVHIVPKNQALQNPASKISLKQVQQPFEQTFRFQVNLPKNQLYVTRVTGRTTMRDLLNQACSEKGLDPHKYALRHPKQMDRTLCDDLSIMEYGHNQVSMVSNRMLPSAVSSENILAMAACSAKSSESSSRSLSPDNSSGQRTVIQPSRPARKRRPAPKPPAKPAPQPPTAQKKETQKNRPSNGPVICHSRTSSDSSGYHEASVLSESPDSNNSSLPDSLPRRSKLPANQEPKPNNKLSRSLSNLHHESTLPQTSMKPAQSASCLAPSRKKKPAPAPPVLAITEEERDDTMTARSSHTLPANARLSEAGRSPVDAFAAQPPSSRLPSPVAPSVDQTKGKPAFSSPERRLARERFGGSPRLTSKVVGELGETVDGRPTSPLLKELRSKLDRAAPSPDGHLVSVRDLLKKFVDSEKPVPNFQLTTYSSSDVRRIVKYSDADVGYYNYNLNNVLPVSGEATVDNTNEKIQANSNKAWERKNCNETAADVRKVVHTKTTAGPLAARRREFYENRKTEANANDDVQGELEIVSTISRVKRFIDGYTDSNDNEVDKVDAGTIKARIIDPEAARCARGLVEERKKQFLSSMSSSEDNGGDEDGEEEGGEEEDGEYDDTEGEDGESVVDEIDRALVSADCDYSESESGENDEARPPIELRLAPVVGIEETVAVSEEYATEFTVPILEGSDAAKPEQSPKRLERTVSLDIDEFEIDSGGVDPPFDTAAETIDARPRRGLSKSRESFEVEVIEDTRRHPEDSGSLSSSGSEGTTVRGICRNSRPESGPSDKSKSVTFSPQARVKYIENEVPERETPSKSKSLFSPKQRLAGLKKRGQNLFGGGTKSKKPDGPPDWSHRDLTDPGVCDCESPDVVYVRVPKNGGRNRAFKIKEVNAKQASLAGGSAAGSPGSIRRRLNDFLDENEGELI